MSSKFQLFFFLLPAPSVIPEEKVEVTTEETLSGLCGGKPADIVFLLDASSSIWGPNFDKQLKFVYDVVDKFDVSLQMTHVAAMTFSDKVHKEFGLHSFGDRLNTLAAIPSMVHLRGGTRTDLAMMEASKMMMGDGRKEVPRLVIVMTDGKSDKPLDTLEQAYLLKKAGITTFAVGIGESVDKEELMGIASDEKYVFTVDTFDALVTLQSILAYEACKVEVIMQADESEMDNNIQPSELIKGKQRIQKL